jgi:hypothetical protein
MWLLGRKLLSAKSAGDAGDGAEDRIVYHPHSKLLIRRLIRMVAGDAGDVCRPSDTAKKKCGDTKTKKNAVIQNAVIQKMRV